MTMETILLYILLVVGDGQQELQITVQPSMELCIERRDESRRRADLFVLSGDLLEYEIECVRL